MSQKPPKTRILHLHSSFNAGGKELRCVQLINAFGADVAHSIVSAVPDAMGAAPLILGSISITYPDKFPPLAGMPTVSRLKRLADAMRGFDLVLTYNWGAMDAVMAHTLFSRAFDLPPLIHHEDGFNSDEAQRLKRRRNWYRQIALARADALVVPSRQLERVALNIWQQPRIKVHRIANGIATRAYGKKPKPDVLPGLIKRKNENWVGTLAGLRMVKDLPRLVRAFANLPEHWQLVILGEGPERAAIMSEAEAAGIEHRVHLPGFVKDPAKVVGLFDIFALSSQSEQFPISVVEAMAAGIPVAAPSVGDIAEMVAEENAPFIVAPGNEAVLADALERLADDLRARKSIGAENRKKARKFYDESGMITRYEVLYAGVMGKKNLG